MKTLKIIWSIALIAGVSFHSSAQLNYLKNVKETQQHSENCTSLFAEWKIDEMINEIVKVLPTSEEEMKELGEKTKGFKDNITEMYGEVVGYEKVSEKTMNDFAIRETHVILLEYHALRLVYTYYKTDKGWILNGFNWDDEWQEEF